MEKINVKWPQGLISWQIRPVQVCLSAGLRIFYQYVLRHQPVEDQIRTSFFSFAFSSSSCRSHFIPPGSIPPYLFFRRYSSAPLSRISGTPSISARTVLLASAKGDLLFCVLAFHHFVHPFLLLSASFFSFQADCFL
jgi:hypothetical protein